MPVRLTLSSPSFGGVAAVPLSEAGTEPLLAYIAQHGCYRSTRVKGQSPDWEALIEYREGS